MAGILGYDRVREQGAEVCGRAGTPLSVLSACGVYRLHDEVVAFVDFMEPTDQERRARELVIARVSDLVKRRFPTCTVTLFGSVAQNLTLPDR